MASGQAFVSRLAAYGSRAALADAHGAYSYGALTRASRALAAQLQTPSVRAPADGRPPRIAYVCPRDNTYVQSQLAVWQAGAIGVPLAENYPASEIEYVPRPASAGALEGAGKADAPGGGAFLIYTSGTTGRPKGVLTTHKALVRQVTALTEAWRWSAEDQIYGVLPLHHVHGVVAVLNCALWSGAAIELAPKFSAADTWATLTRPPGAPQGQPSLFMAVPTVYAKLLEFYDAQPEAAQAALRAALRAPASRIRLMVSGSAALPQPIAQRWREVSGQQLLERYGMTEFAMGISNPYDTATEGPRKLNSVGRPLPGYEARLVPDGSGAPPPEGFVAAGELHMRGEGVFSEYWGRPEATRETFAEDGWFVTGDYAARDADGYYYILGRLSADIIKSGGYKISALDIERVLLDHPQIAEVAVLGVPDDTYGERIAAVIMPRAPGAGAEPSAAECQAAADALSAPEALAAFQASLKDFCRDKMPAYKLPTVLRVVPSIPRNAMGKVNKKELRKALFTA